MKIPVSVTAEQMDEINRLVIYQYGIQIVQSVESTGHALARICRRYLGGKVDKKKIIVLAGTDRIAAGGIAAARYLHGWGGSITVALVLHEDALKKSALNQLNIVRSMELPIESATDIGLARLRKFDLIIDALLGYKTQGTPSSEFASVIAAANKVKKPIVSLDVPSGMDATTGQVYHSCIRANATVSLGLPKTGLLRTGAAKFIGDLWLADIGIPPETYTKIGLKVDNPFIGDDIVLLQKEEAASVTA
ncbi:MAG: NAD(P)H-hydrate epimerase [Firmicutes bacterium]|nr:NAD(P)H-hydrate epimerase [Bacillota bacterium]